MAALGAPALLAQERHFDVLALVPSELSRPASVAILEGLRHGLAEALPGQTQVTAETSAGTPREAQWFPIKYGDRKFDLIVAVSDGVYLRAVNYRERFWPGLPIVFLTNRRSGIAPPPLAPNTVVLDISSSPRESAELAIQLFPKTTHLALIAGNTPGEISIGKLWAQDLRARLPGREIIEWAALTPPQLRDHARALPPNSVILLGMFAGDLRGVPATYQSLAHLLDSSTTAPVFDWTTTGIGTGALGGFVADLTIAGAESAALAVRLLRGESAETIGPQASKLGVYQFDARQLTTFGIPEVRLPPGSRLLFRTPTLWEVYGPVITAAYIAFILLSTLLAFLLLERRRRLQSQAHLADRLHFETIVADTSAQLTNRAHAAVAIEEALRRLTGWTGANGAVFEAHLPGFGSGPCRYQWPAQAEPSPTPMASLPLFLDGRVAGQLQFDGPMPQTWDTWKPRLRTFGEMLLNAVARQESERNARASEALTQSMIDSIDGFVVTVNAQGNVIFANRGWDALTGSAGEAILPRFETGRSYVEAWLRSPHSAFAEQIQTLCHDQRAHFGLEFNPRPRRWIHIHGEPLDRHEGGCVIIHRDITAAKLAGLERAALAGELAHRNRVAALTELATSLAHEINQPLTAIVSNGESARALLRAPQVDLTELGQVVREVVEDGRRAASVIGHMRALLKKDRPTEITRLDLGRLVRETAQLVEADAQARRIRLTFGLCPQAAVHADAVQLQQVLLNLLTNAFDAVAGQPEERRHVHVRAAGSRLDVEDSGPGVPPAERETIFDQFFSTKPNGLGIGLAISRTLAHAMGGRIWVEDASLGGAKFSVDFSPTP